MALNSEKLAADLSADASAGALGRINISYYRILLCQDDLRVMGNISTQRNSTANRTKYVCKKIQMFVFVFSFS